MKTKILIILCVAVLAACKKDKKENEPVVEQKTYIKKQTFHNIGVYTWNYDEQNRLKEIVFISANEASNRSITEKVIAYDAQNRILEMKFDYVEPTAKDIRSVNTYNAAGKLERMQYYDDATNVTTSYNVAAYPNAQQTIINSYNNAGVLSGSTVQTLTSDLKNLAEIKYYTGVNGTGTLNSTTTYTNFDNTIKDYSPLYPVGYGFSPKRENVSALNIVTQASGATQTFTYTYEVNADGYVTKRINATGTFNTYEYIKK